MLAARASTADSCPQDGITCGDQVVRHGVRGACYTPRVYLSATRVGWQGQQSRSAVESVARGLRSSRDQAPHSVPILEPTFGVHMSVTSVNAGSRRPFGHQTRFWNPKMPRTSTAIATDPHHQPREDAAALQRRDEVHPQLSAKRGTILMMHKRQAREVIAWKPARRHALRRPARSAA